MLLSLACLLWPAGCSTPHTAALDNARISIAQARANTLVTTNAPVALREAEQSLQKAENADNEQQQRHYAYLAQRQSEEAVYKANQKAAQQGIAGAVQERQQVLLQSREQQAAQARMQALAAEQRAMTAERRARLATQQSGQLQSQLSELQARRTSRGNVQMTLSDVMFATNEAVLQPGAVASLNKLADILKQNPNEKVYIEGHTDNTGSAAYNRQLSQARADAVRDALVQAGISPARIVAHGMGESFPVASNDNRTGRQLNRRVDIIVTG
jgi:outer membrane protein OmpA-like peptidoglycan-associated protein